MDLLGTSGLQRRGRRQSPCSPWVRQGLGGWGWCPKDWEWKCLNTPTMSQGQRPNNWVFVTEFKSLTHHSFQSQLTGCTAHLPSPTSAVGLPGTAKPLSQGSAVWSSCSLPSTHLVSLVKLAVHLRPPGFCQHQTVWVCTADRALQGPRANIRC